MSAPNNLNSKKLTGILLPVGILYILFSALTATLGIIGSRAIDAMNSLPSREDFWATLYNEIGLEAATEVFNERYAALEHTTVMPDFLPDGFVFLNSVRNNALPEGVLRYFFIFLIIFAAFRLIIGGINIIFGKKQEKGAILGLFGKIDLWIVILLTVFIVFFIDGFGFVWLPIISFIPTVLLLHGSAKLDNRPGKASREEARTAKVFLIPAFLGLTFITYIPLAAVFGISLFHWNIPFAPEFAGLTNIINLFSADSFFWNSVRVTLIYALLAVVLGMVYSMCIALLLNRKIPGRTFFRTVFYLPFIIPVVSSLIVFGLIYSHNGVINNIINMFGGERRYFLLDNATIIPALAFIAVWASGNIVVIKMAGLANVPRTYLESAEVDGANAWHRFWKITIPCMSPIIFYNMLMSLITHMQVVVPSLIFAGGGQAGATVIPQSFRFIAYELYMTGLGYGQLGRAGAISFALFILIGILTIILFSTSKSWLFYEGGGPS